MLKHLFILFLLSQARLITSGQECLHKNLSASLDIYTKIARLKNKTGDDSCIITITIKNKSTKKIIQTIKYNSIFLYSSVFVDCNFVRSYTTHKNINKEVGDYDFGDLVIADLNFDGREDLLLKNDSGGNGGPFYTFYMQNNNEHFVVDNFLTDSVGSFPKYINPGKRTITTQIHASAFEECKTVYQFNMSTKKWKKIRRTFVKY